jgi:hypothetical protein
MIVSLLSCRRHTRKFGDLEDYSVMNRAYDGPTSREMLRLLQGVQGP